MGLLRGVLGAVLLLVFAQNVGATPVYRDHPTVSQPAADELEVSAEIFGMNDTLDFFNFRESEYVCPGCTPGMNFGDTEGVGLLVNYGLSDRFSLQSSYRRWASENAFGRLVIDSGELSLRFRPLKKVVLQGGVRGNRSADFSVSGADQLGILFGYLVGPSFLFTNGSSHYVVRYGDTTLTIRKADDPLKIRFSRMQDLTPYLRLITGGEILPGWQGSLFVEGGRSWVDTEISLVLDPFLGALVKPAFLGDLERQEDYVKIGFDLSTTFLGAHWNLNGHYVRLQRDSDLGYVNFNRVLQGEVAFPLASRLQIFLSGTWYRRQFNGSVPFMYNRYSQTTFDHDYGLVSTGLVVGF
ncbi:MAG: hypothetical protein C0621_04165 [Desulfuromonas sp.]|nr:MAG: hypothetical protein C0621_04165 [Desulfuromonas sp.]